MKNHTINKNKWLILITGIISLLVLVCAKGINRTLDSVLLIENRAPVYQNYLQDDLAVQRCVTHDVDKYENYCNYFVSSAVVQKDSYSISVGNDGSITFSGTNDTGDFAFEELYLGPLLPPGTYRLDVKSDTPVTHDEFLVYLEGWNTAADGTIVNTYLAPTENSWDTFTIADNSYERYYIGVRIAPGYSNSSLHFYAQVVPSSARSDILQPISDTQNFLSDSSLFYNFKTVYLPKSQLSLSTTRDWKDFLHSLRSQVKDPYDWYSVIFDDGTGIEFENCDPSKGKYGEVDPLGRVTKVTGYLYDISDYLSLTDLPQ